MSKFKKPLISLGVLLVLLYFASPSLLGFSLLHTSEAIRVATNMGAKLACSARYVSGFEPQLIRKDLASYSPVNNLLELEYATQQKSVSAKLFGMAEAKAQYYPGLGCNLVMDKNQELAELRLDELSPTAELWPAGEEVNSQKNYQQLADKVLRQDNLAGLQTRALLVVKDGEIVAESYVEGVSEDTPLLGWSMAKSTTAIMFGRLQQMQRVTMSQDELFQQWYGDERKRIQLRHLLNMSSGLDFDETYAPGSDATRMLFLSASASDLALASVLADKPGSYFYYSSGTTNILTRWLHEELGGSQQTLDFLQQELLKPLAMANTVFETDSSGVLVGSSYMYASGRDWARLGTLMLQQGSLNGRQLLAPEWVQQASTPNTSDNDKRYGYQFWLNRGGPELRWPELPQDAYAMLGNREQVVMVLPSENMVLVRLGWSKSPYPTGRNFARFLQL